jgi:predicted ArsR family transcriptional regulator
MEGSILRLLSRHEALGFDHIVAQLGRPPDAVRSALVDMREGGLVAVLSIGETEAHVRAGAGASYWRLTDRGREELVRRRS